MPSSARPKLGITSLELPNSCPSKVWLKLEARVSCSLEPPGRGEGSKGLKLATHLLGLPILPDVILSLAEMLLGILLKWGCD